MSVFDFFNEIMEEPVFVGRVSGKGVHHDASPLKADGAVYSYLGSKTVVELEQLNRADLFTPNMSCASPYAENSTIDKIGDTEFQSRGEMLRVLAKVDTYELKRNISVYGLGLDENTSLSTFRAIRSCYPSGNQLSKFAYTAGQGTTYEKFNFGDVGFGVFFGCAGPHHHAYKTTKVACCYDTAAIGTPFFRVGNIVDWKEIMKRHPGVKVIYSDVSVGDSEGFTGFASLKPVYEEMVASGYELVYKNHTDFHPVGKILDWKKPRMHNEEIILRVVAGAIDFDFMGPIKKKMLQANFNRTSAMISRNCKFIYKGGSCVGMRISPVSVVGVGVTVKRKGVDRFISLKQSPSVNVRKLFAKKCHDPGYAFGDVAYVPMDLDVELPLVLEDYPVLMADLDIMINNIFFYVRKKLKGKWKFDNEVGWYAVNE